MGKDEEIAELEYVLRCATKEIARLKHVIIAMGGISCICDECAPNPESKAERNALNAARTA